jgi:D-alanyl-D-alanine carboxypeptidase/D-alanyl-D-alanine-endopeptidase (penicillin-binding protein 4)
MAAHRRRQPPRYATAAALAVLAVSAAGLALQLERPGNAPKPLAKPSPTSPVLTARRVPAVIAAPFADGQLDAQLGQIVAASPGPMCLTVDAGARQLYSKSPTAPLVPASLEKLVTAAAALHVLGPDTTLTTTLKAAAPPRGDTIGGDVWFVGGGDPLLMSNAFVAHLRHPPPERTDLAKIADALVAAGVKHITGGLLGDDSRYDIQRVAASWPSRFATLAESGPLSALNADDGLDVFPPGPDDRVPKAHPAPDPPGHAAELLRVMLTARGVTVDGGAASGAAPPNAVLVAKVDSAPVHALVEEMLRESDNETAEMLTKEMALKSGKVGSTAAGVEAIAGALRDLGLPVEGSVQVDGSGLSGDDRMTCALVRALLAADGENGVIGAGLPLAGRTGTLEKRFATSSVAGHLRAKTGTLNQVTALAGFLPTSKGAAISFAYILNIAPTRIINPTDIAIQDALVAALDGYPAGPGLDALGPLP